LKSLEKVKYYERNFKKKYMSRMATLWRESYKIEFKKPIQKRAQFVFFK